MIQTIYERLLAHFGAPRNWWPIFGDDAPFEMLLGAVLVQQT
ncbi:MAG: DNA repair protein, partial [Chloroflexales bacterium]|nr:DNA repair protein [Chloroflexales bacterium]